jgi:outer membrane protein OmpA-like peptidoglycan-associated protein
MITMRVIAASYVLSLVPLTAAAQQPPAIPLRAGLTVVQAVVMTTGDAELIVRVDDVNAEGVRITYSGQFLTNTGDDPLSALLGGGKKPARKGELARVKGVRTIRRADMESARHWQSQFGNNQPQVFPGTTSFNVSALVFTELKTKGQSEFSCSCAPGLEGALGSLGSALGSVLGNGADTKPLEQFGKLAGTLRRVEAKPVPVAVLVNDVRVSLPAIHAAGKLGAEQADFYFLDDPQNRLLLRGRVGPQSANVVKISFPTESPRIATALEKAGRVDVYGIYFDFGSAMLRPESEPVLKEIADALAQNAAWKLKIDGHTDNIGGDPANLDLSRRRAASVRDALVGHYKVDKARLTADGFGASRPKEPNTTPEGRARNRRVELVRQ